MRHQRWVTAGRPERTHRAAVRREGSTPRQTVAVLLGAALVSGAVGTWWMVRSAGRVLDAGLVAVAPLALGAADLEPVAPQVESDLTVTFTMGGGVRAVPAAAAHAAWDPRAAPARAALELAQRTRAGLVVLAQLWPVGPDSVRLIGRLLDVSHNRVLAMAEARAARGHLATLGVTVGARLRAQMEAQPANSTR